MEMTAPPPLIVLSKQDLTALMPFGEYVSTVADAFWLHAEGRSAAPPPDEQASATRGKHPTVMH
ncbi:MAG: hypothetical protein JO000_22265 [Alphaproteobacteria bacterium]|nr:hypothetical protein [Alphaproteobacteria bacterium]